MIALHLLIIAYSAVVLYYFRNSHLTSRNVVVIVTNAVVIGLNVAFILYRLLALPQ